MPALTSETVHKTLKQFFPAKNDDFECAYVEELKELNDFGITTEEQLFDLLQKRTDEVMEIDRSPMADYEIKMHSDDVGEEFVGNRLRKGFWFSYPALLRIVLELEYGKSYQEYAARRDGLAEPGVAPIDSPATAAGNSGVTKGPPSAPSPAQAGKAKQQKPN